MNRLAAILFLVLVPVAEAAARETPVFTPAPVAKAVRVPDGAVKLDGRLDEAAWRDAPEHGDFRQCEPLRGGDPSVETFFRVVYDDRAVYFGVRCPEADMSLVSNALSRRDDLRNSDIISIYVDPYHDRTTAYNFRANLHGVVADAYLTDDVDRDWSWDAVWDVATRAGADGWSAEFRIPFSALRYRAGDDRTWGLQVYRWLHGRGEDTGWACWERDLHGFVSRFGTLTGLSGLKAARRLEVTPYVVQSVTDPAPASEDLALDRNLGLDVKYGLAAHTTLVATVQPDFGQVEADPAVLNLSPFETSYAEKRPFFVEGARAFVHPDFGLFYSRRIGTGVADARIRGAAKLTGKTRGGLSFAALAAATDVAVPGRAHNPFDAGGDRAFFAVLRGGLENAGGTRRINLMQTAVLRDPGSFAATPARFRRNGFATGLDFALRLADRTYEVRGAFVGTVVDPHPGFADPAPRADVKRGTGGRLHLAKTGGRWRASLGGAWEHDQLDFNDAGLLLAPDDIEAYAGLGYLHEASSPAAFWQQGSVEATVRRNWLFAGRVHVDPADPARTLWSYGDRVPAGAQGGLSTWWQTRDYWTLSAGAWYQPDGLDKYLTRDFAGVRGPLMITKSMWGGWLDLGTDYRRSLRWELGFDMATRSSGSRARSVEARLTWQQGDRMHHALSLGYESARPHAQWLGNYADPGGGLGGVSYVFAGMDRRTWELTLRSSLLFTPDQSLELYLQPFLSVGDFHDARELARPASYEFTPYAAGGFDPADRDFSYAAVNVNLVYRWEYRPGSTLFVVWAHTRDRYEERAGDRGFANDFDAGRLFDNRAENRVLVKFTYWFPL
jgi:hypothetical protein